MRLNVVLGLVLTLSIALFLLGAAVQPEQRIAPQIIASVNDGTPPPPPPVGGGAGTPPPAEEHIAAATVTAQFTPDLSSVKSIRCALYAGPLRWRRHPANGRAAPTQLLQALPAGTTHQRLAPPRRALVQFDGAALRLLADGPFAQAADTNARFLRSLKQDRLFFSFRAMAARPPARRPSRWRRRSPSTRPSPTTPFPMSAAVRHHQREARGTALEAARRAGKPI
jgi:hypothetical protein